MVPQSVFATIYAPGETLNPDCAPGPGCDVSVPATTNIANTDLTLTGARILTMNGNGLTFHGTTADLLFANDGSITFGGNAAVNGGSITSSAAALSLAVNGTGTGTVQIGTGAGSSTPDLLVLDAKNNSSADPAGGVNGASYYNSSSNKFRCYENGAWGDCIFSSTSSAQNLTLARIGNSTFSTLQDLQNVFHSAGWTSGGTITDAGGGTVNVAAGTGLIRTSNSATGQVDYIDWAADNGVAIPLNSTRYIGVEYNGGAPQVSVRTSANWNLKTDFPIGVVVNEGGTLNIFSDTQAVGDHAATMIQREYETMPLEPDTRDGGLMLGEIGTRNVTLTAGAVWDRLNRYVIPHLDTSLSGNFDAYYRDGGVGFTKVTGLTQWPNAQYDNNSGTLATMTDGDYAVLWFYLDTNAKVSMVYGRDQYTTDGLAEAEPAPDTLPSRLMVSGKLLGKIVFQKSSSTAHDVISLLAMSSSNGGVTSHSDLTGLDFASSGHVGFADSLSGTNDNITAMTAVTSITPAAAITITPGAASVWSTSAGALTLDAAAALNLGTSNATAVSIGKSGATATANGNLAVVGNLSFPRGANYPTVGVQNNVSLGAGSYIRYTGASPATFTGLAAGTDGQFLTLETTATAGTLTLANNNGSSSAANRIITGTGANLDIPSDTSVLLMYEATSAGESHWHVVSPPSNVANTTTTAFLQGGNTFGATGTVGTSDFFGLNLITNNTTALALDTSGNGTLAGGLTVTGGSVATPATVDLTVDSGTTGAVKLGTGLNAKAITIGNTTGATSLALKSGSGGIALTGNTSITGANTFTVGTGAFAVSGNFATPRGSDFSVTGAQNDFSIGTGSLFRFTGSSPVTISGIAGGTDGRLIRLFNASASSNITLTSQDGASAAANQIKTVNGVNAVIEPNGTVSLQYDSGASLWRVIALPVESIALVQGGNAFGAAVSVGSTDANALHLVTNNATALSLDTLGNAALTGDLTVTGGDVASPAATALNVMSGTSGILTLDSGTTGAVNVGTDASHAKTVTVGNPTGNSALNLQSGTGNISLQAAGTGAVGYVQIGGGGGTATPDLLVLDLKNDNGTDPAGGVNGASYYNATDNKFRCFEGGAWKDCDTTGGTTTLQTAYNAGQAITTSASHDLALTLTSGNFTASGAGAVSLTPTSASSFTSGGALTFTAGAASTWGTTAGDLSLQAAGTGATGHVQIGAGSTGSATPDLLVLDTKSAVSGSGDPSGAKGAMYYNIALDKLRCFEGAAWKDCDTGGGAGLTSLNGQSGSSQTFVTGTSGSDFNISSGSDIHTFNLPDAGTVARGLVTTGTQTFGGSKTFNDNALVNGNATLGDAAGDSLTINAATVTLAGASTVIDTTGTGTLSINTASNHAITVGSGLFTTNGAATVTGTFTNIGNYVTPAGTDYSTPNGSQNDVNLGAGSLFRFTGTSQTTFTGIAGGTDGRQIRLMNSSAATNLILTNDSGSSGAANRIYTTNGGNLTVGPGVSVGLQYDANATHWRVVVLPATSTTVSGFAFVNGGNAFGGTAALGTTDGNALNLITNNATAFALDASGNGVLTGGLTVNAGTVATPAATDLTIDSGTTGAINLGAAGNAKTITIGNTTTTSALALKAGSGAVTVTSPSATFQSSTATNDKLALVPATGGANSFVGTLTSVNLSTSDKTWTFPNLTGNVLLDTSACTSTGSFACASGNNVGSDVSLGTTDAFGLNLITGGATRFALASNASTLTGQGSSTLTSTGSMLVDAASGLSLGTTTATSVAVGATGVTTTNNGSLTSTQTFTASNGLTLTTGALNLAATSGNVDLHSANMVGASPLSFDGATADAVKTIFAITDPTVSSKTITFPNATITVNAAVNISGTTLASNVVNSSLVTVGALSTGSIASGFGSISTTNDITTSGNVSTTGSGTLTSAGTLTASNGLTLTTGALNLTAASGTVDVHSATIANGSPLVFDGATADALKTTFAITDPTGVSKVITFPDATITVNAAADISGTTLASNVVTSSLTTVGALASGSIASGFGTISTGNTITTTGTMGTAATTAFTGATGVFSTSVSTPSIISASNANVAVTPNGSGSFVVNTDANSNMQVTASAVPTADILAITDGGNNSGTNGVDGLSVTAGSSNASGDAIHVVPSYAGGSNDVLTYNVIEADAFSPSNASGTDTVNGLKLGALTDPGASVTSTALNIGSGWDNVLTVNATPILNGSGVLLSAGLSGSYTGVTGVGALTSGSIATGFTSINGTPIGTTSASTGKFTTLTSTGATDLANAGASNVTIATTGTGTVAIGNATGTFALVSSGGLNVTTAGALTGVASVDTIAHSATAITFAGAGAISSTTSSALTIDSGSTGDVNLGTGATAKAVTIGNTTGATAVNVNAGTGGVVFTVGPTSSSSKVQIGNSASATPDLLVLDNGSADPAGTNGGMYYSTALNKFRCYENGAWANCITAPQKITATYNAYGVNQAASATTALNYLVPTNTTAFSIVVTGTVEFVAPTAGSFIGCTAFNSAAVTAGSVSVHFRKNGADVSATNYCTLNTTTTRSNSSTVASGTETFAAGDTIGVALVSSGLSPTTSEHWVNFSVLYNTGADVAEAYYAKDATLIPGDVVSLDPSLFGGVQRSRGTDDARTIGIISTAPALKLGDGPGPEGGTEVFVALSGRVPVRVSTENGPVVVGDLLTPSSVPGVAMKANPLDRTVGQALTSYDGSGEGQVIVLVKNSFALDGFAAAQRVLLGDVSPKAGADNGLSTLVAAIQAETAHDPVAIIAAKIAAGTQFLTDFTAARVTAIRGYFDEAFAKKVHTEELCLKKSDGTETCVNGDQVDSLLHGSTSAPTAAAPAADTGFSAGTITSPTAPSADTTSAVPAPTTDTTSAPAPADSTTVMDTTTPSTTTATSTDTTSVAPAPTTDTTTAPAPADSTVATDTTTSATAPAPTDTTTTTASPATDATAPAPVTPSP